MKINITELPITISTCKKENCLQRAIKLNEKLLELNFSVKEIYEGEITKPYIFGANRNAIDILQNNRAPFIFMEDDAEIIEDNYKNILDIPSECDILYLGGATHANPYFINEDEDMILNFTEGARNSRLAFKNINEDYVRIYNMFCAHAIIFLTEKGRVEFLSAIEQYKNYPFDIIFSQIMPNLNVYMLRNTFFYQNDGHNEQSTKDIFRKQVPHNTRKTKKMDHTKTFFTTKKK